jgi:hypothetical protein
LQFQQHSSFFFELFFWRALQIPISTVFNLIFHIPQAQMPKQANG